MTTDNMTFDESVSQNGGMSKIQRYGWKVTDKPGTFETISKHIIRVDESYQRDEAIQSKVNNMAQEWSWMACGVILVAKRFHPVFHPTPAYYAYDGQHRVLAARRRADILKLPCLVFETETPKDEAKGFIAVNTNRKVLPSDDRFKAKVIAGDCAALKVNELLLMAGRKAGKTANANNIKCISTLIHAVEKNEQAIFGLWPIIIELSKDKPIYDRIIQAFVFIESHLPPNVSLTDKNWRERILSVGVDELMSGAQKSVVYNNGGGAKIWADGILKVLNKGLRNRLELQSVDRTE